MFSRCWSLASAARARCFQLSGDAVGRVLSCRDDGEESGSPIRWLIVVLRMEASMKMTLREGV